MEKPEKCAHWQFTKGCLSCEFAPAFVPSVLQTLQQKARETLPLCVLDILYMDAIVASAFQAGKGAAVEYIKKEGRKTSYDVEGSHGELMDASYYEVYTGTLEEARNAE